MVKLELRIYMGPNLVGLSKPFVKFAYDNYKFEHLNNDQIFTLSLGNSYDLIDSLPCEVKILDYQTQIMQQIQYFDEIEKNKNKLLVINLITNNIMLVQAIELFVKKYDGVIKGFYCTNKDANINDNESHIDYINRLYKEASIENVCVIETPENDLSILYEKSLELIDELEFDCYKLSKKK